MKPYDLIILGSGIAGLSAAQYAGSQGARVLIIDPGNPGGHSVFKGPEILLESVNTFAPGVILPSWSEIKDKVQIISNERSVLWQDELKRMGVAVAKGFAKVVDSNHVVMTDGGEPAEHQGENILVATGSSVCPLSSFPFEPELIFKSEALWDLEELPSSLLISGSNLESLAWAELLRRLGVKVFFTHEATEILDGFDPELIAFLEKGMKRSKVKLLLKKTIKSIFKSPEGLAITLDGGIKFTVDKLLVCGERKVDLSHIFTTGNAPDQGSNGEILVDEKMKTTVSNIFAAGSVCGHVRNPYRSQEEGRVAAANALGKKRSFHPEWVPDVIRLSQTVASVGCFEGNAHHFGFRGIEGRSIGWKKEHDFPLDTGDSFCKIVADRDRREIVGGQAAGAFSAEMISMIQMGVRKGMTPRDFTQLQASWGGPFAPLHEAAIDCLSKLNQER